ncbi:MAG: LysR family transcriptional regulator [Rhodospirillaceae bacterium]|jgi:LysR family transcriptional regulator, glycine cleavage system transcriptional activator|nr:LysR family transcriptional regulator [Rhodospirillaceae bacterium]MBT7612317.1 LysR family transcriptional regulator [Rhodospirillaceae bacterium]
MANLRQRLPPLNSLVAFEAVARHGSMTRAADELLVTREAVSRQIHTLENFLGVSLFLRVHRAVELTAEGGRFQATIETSLDAIARASDSLRETGASSRVTVMATIAITSFWLTPRLPGFRERHPDIEIRLRASDALLDMRGDRIDLALRYGDGRWQGVDSMELFPTLTFPVCSPDYLARHGPINQPTDLLGHTLLNLDGPSHAGEDWAWWLDGADVQAQGPLHILGFDSYANIIQAALEGQGIALGFSRIVESMLTSGKLIRPVGPALSKGQAVHLVTLPGIELSPAVNAFRSWLIEEAD